MCLTSYWKKFTDNFLHKIIEHIRSIPIEKIICFQSYVFVEILFKKVVVIKAD